MELFEVITKRHSYRGPFTDQAVPCEALERMVQAGIQAPSARNMQTTTFVMVEDPALVREINAMDPPNPPMQQAKAYIACVVDEHPEPIHQGRSFQVEDCSAAVENILLAVTALGYATVWVDGWLRDNDHAGAVGRLIGLPEGKTIRVILPVGVPAETHAQKERFPFASRAWFNQYGAQ